LFWIPRFGKNEKYRRQWYGKPKLSLRDEPLKALMCLFAGNTLEVKSKVARIAAVCCEILLRS